MLTRQAELAELASQRESGIPHSFRNYYLEVCEKNGVPGVCGGLSFCLADRCHPPAHRDSAAMNGAQLLRGKGDSSGTMTGPPAHRDETAMNGAQLLKA